MNIQETPHQSVRNIMCRWNIPLSNLMQKSDPNARFNNIVRGHGSGDVLTKTVTQSFTNLNTGPLCHFNSMNIVHDFDGASQMLENASKTASAFVVHVDRLICETKCLPGDNAKSTSNFVCVIMGCHLAISKLFT